LFTKIPQKWYRLMLSWYNPKNQNQLEIQFIFQDKLVFL
jgi:hypothetical protein